MANRFDLAVHKITGKRLPKVKRVSHYVQNPKEYGMTCPKCGGTNIEWSEFDEKIWCYSCKRDLKPTVKSSGIFSGPVPIKTAELLGMCFDRWDMVNKKFMVWNDKEEKYISLTKDAYIKYKKGHKNE